MDDYTWDGGTAPDWRKRAEAAEAALAEAREVYARFEHDTLLGPLAREGMEQAAQQQAAATAARVQELEKRAEIAENMARVFADSIKAWGNKVSELERENAELRAKLELVSDYVHDYAEEMQYGDPYELPSFTGWLAKRPQAVQP